MKYLVRTMFSQKPGFIETDVPLEKGLRIKVVKEYGEVPAVVVVPGTTSVIRCGVMVVLWKVST